MSPPNVNRNLGLVFLLISASLIIMTQPLSARWPKRGVAIADSSSFTYYFGHPIIADGSGGAVIFYNRFEQWRGVLHGARIDSNGVIAWNKRISARPDWFVVDDPQILLAENRIFVAWPQYAISGDSAKTFVIAQCLNNNGELLWGFDGVIAADSTCDHRCLKLASDGAGGVIIAWMLIDREEDCLSLWCQRIDARGARRWSAQGRFIAGCMMWGPFSLVSDAAGGAYIFYENNESNIAVQHIASDGNLLFSSPFGYGKTICDSYGAQGYPAAISDGSGGAIICWVDHQSPYFSDRMKIVIQRIDMNGNVLWGAGGVRVCLGDNLQWRQWNQGIAPDGHGGSLVTWRSGNAIYAQRIDSNGTRMWGESGALIYANGSWMNDMASDFEGGGIVAWIDYATGVMAQRVDSAGSRQWNSAGVQVSQGRCPQMTPAVVSDGAGGAIFAWINDDMNRGTIYVQRINKQGKRPAVPLFEKCWIEISTFGIELNWTLKEPPIGLNFRIYRSDCEWCSYCECRRSSNEYNGLNCSYEDRTAAPDQTYWYRVDIVEDDQQTELFRMGPVTVPRFPLSLDQNIPNPFNPSTAIRYYLPINGTVRLDIFNVAGKLIVRLVDERQHAGRNQATWNGEDKSGRPVSAGIYYCRLTHGGKSLSRKLVLLK